MGKKHITELSKGGRVYLDYASTTLVDPVVLKAMLPYFSEKYGNAGSVHFFGQEAIKALDEAREAIADSIGAKFNEVIFTGSATEANNLALRGVFNAARPFFDGDERPKIITSDIEHESVLETCRDLEKEGAEAVYLPVNKYGAVDLKTLKKELDSRTILVSVMYANNEIGTIEPLKKIAELLKNYKIEKLKNSEDKDNLSIFQSFNQQLNIADSLFNFPLFHTDAAQAFQFLDCRVGETGADLMTLSAHKIYGPKGIGVLYVRNRGQFSSSLVSSGYALNPILTGGGQEFGLRSGTENVALAVGFAAAARLAEKNRKKDAGRIFELRNYFYNGLRKIFPKIELNGPVLGDLQSRLPNNLNIYLPHTEAQFFLTKLDMAGIAASSGSACRARSLEPSYVVSALGYDKKRARHSVRFSLGKFTDKSEIDEALARLRAKT